MKKKNENELKVLAGLTQTKSYKSLIFIVTLIFILVCNVVIPYFYSDFISLVVQKNCEPELSYILSELFNMCLA